MSTAGTPSDRAWSSAARLRGLRRFAAGITLLTVVGHAVLGFEPPWAQPVVALLVAYGSELLLESVDAWRLGRRPRFVGRGSTPVDFLLSAHISGLAVAMLLYSNARLWPIAFASAAAIASKAVLRIRVEGRERHVFNPSNFGIALTLILFPWVGIAPAYQFTENTSGVVDWLVPAVLVAGGLALNARVTRRLPLIAAWLCAFVAQAALRSAITGASFGAGLVPMTGVAFLLFTFYMVSDPATTPATPRAQVAFGVAVALAYGALMAVHVVFGLFFALGITCSLRYLRLVLLDASATAPRTVARAAVSRALPRIEGDDAVPGLER